MIRTHLRLRDTSEEYGKKLLEPSILLPTPKFTARHSKGTISFFFLVYISPRWSSSSSLTTTLWGRSGWKIMAALRPPGVYPSWTGARFSTPGFENGLLLQPFAAFPHLNSLPSASWEMNAGSSSPCSEVMISSAATIRHTGEFTDSPLPCCQCHRNKCLQQINSFRKYKRHHISLAHNTKIMYHFGPQCSLPGSLLSKTRFHVYPDNHCGPESRFLIKEWLPRCVLCNPIDSNGWEEIRRNNGRPFYRTCGEAIRTEKQRG